MNWFRTTLLLAGLTALLMLVGQTLGGHTGAVLALGFALVMNFSAYWFSDRLVLALSQAEEVNAGEVPELYEIVRTLTSRAGLPMPKVYIIPEETPNAFATGRSPDHAVVAVTSGILRILSRQELTGVLAHELSHVQHRDTLVSTIAATIAGAIGMMANMAQWSLMFGAGRQSEDSEGHGALGMFLAILLAPITATLIQLAVSRSREYAADEAGAKLCGHPLWLANALRKLETANRAMPVMAAQMNPATAHLYIVNPLSGGAIAHLFSTHPPIEQRIQRLEKM